MKFPRVVFEGSARWSKRRYRIVQTRPGDSKHNVELEMREFDSLKRPRWELVDLGIVSPRDVLAIVASIAVQKRRRAWRR